VAGAGDDYGYIIRLIQYLDRRHGIRFFIGSRDFDVLYHWWEKRVPEALVREGIDRVVERFRRRGRPLTRFSSFSTEVRRGYEAFLSLAVGGERPEPADEHASLKAFMAALPAELEFARNDLAAVFQRLQEGKPPDAGPLEEKLLSRFAADDELNAKCAWFLNNLAPPLRRPEIERRYRLNFLMGRYGIPPLE
jgi:AcrR family transcriptional regulator